METSHVAQGNMRVASKPLLLKATVGPGFAVAVFLPKSRGGGLAHLPFKPQPVCFEGENDLDWMEKPLERFVAALYQLSPDLQGSKADIVGGADSLGVFPLHLREYFIRKQVVAIEGLLAKHGIRVRKTVVGGEIGRSVTADLGASRIRCHKVNRSREKRLIFPAPIQATAGRPAYRITSVGAGHLFVDQSPNHLSALLGSCVGIALYDASSGIGGLVHVMMPENPNNGAAPAKYADSAVQVLADAMVAAGADRRQFQAKIAGGANVLFHGPETSHYQIGKRNIEKVRASLDQAGIQLISENVGGLKGRKMTVDLANFDVSIKILSEE